MILETGKGQLSPPIRQRGGLRARPDSTRENPMFDCEHSADCPLAFRYGKKRCSPDCPRLAERKKKA